MFNDHKDLIREWMYGSVTLDEVCNLIAEGVGLSSKLLLEELAFSCRNMKFINDEIPLLINKIRSKGINCVIATDNMDTFRQFTIPGMSLENLFDDFLISSELDVYKYDVDGDSIPFFDDYLKRKNLLYEDVILLDDAVDKKGNFKRLGFEIFNVNKPEDLMMKLKEFAQ